MSVQPLSPLLDDPSRTWSRAAPTAPRDIEALVEALSFDLPPAYLALLRLTDGAEGSLGIAPGWAQLWASTAVLELNEAYALSEFLPGFFAIGSDGGGELFVFPTDSSEPSIFIVPAVGLSPALLQPLSPSMLQFLLQLGLSGADGGA